jgi:hypothetical protein
MNDLLRKRIEYSVKIFLLLMFVVTTIFGARQFLDDDACIAYRYVLNLVNGNGLVPYHNGPRLEGYSNSALVFSTASLAFLLKIKDFDGILRIGLFFLSVASLAGLLILFYWGKTEKTKYWYFPSILLAGYHPFAYVRMSGLETPLYMFFLLSTAYFFVFRRFKSGLIMAVLAGLTRPEGVLIVSPLLMIAAIDAYKQKKWKGLRSYLGWSLLLFVIPLTAFLSWRFAYFGELLPITVHAKTHLDEKGVFGDGGFKYIWQGADRNPFWAAIYAIKEISKCSGINYLWKEFSTDLVLAGLFFLTVWRFVIYKWETRYEIAIVFIQLAFIIAVGGDDPHFGRYRFLLPIFPILFRSSTLIMYGLEKVFIVVVKRLPSLGFQYGMVIVLIIVPFYNTDDGYWYPSWGAQIYQFVDNPGYFLDQLNKVVNPEPWVDFAASKYLAEQLPNQGEGLSIGSGQGGTFLLHLKSEFQDNSGLLSRDYSLARNYKEKEELFKNNPPDINAVYNGRALTCKGWIEAQRHFPEAKVMLDVAMSHE